MKSFYPDPRWKWFWRTHLLIAVGIVIVTLVVDSGMVVRWISTPEFFTQSDPLQMGMYQREMETWFTWAIPGDLLLIPMAMCQYGFCGQLKYFSKPLAETAFWIASVYIMFRFAITPRVPGYRIGFAVTLFLVSELIVMWLYVYRSPHLWKSGILANS